MGAFTNLPENGSIPYEVFWKPLVMNKKLTELGMEVISGKIGRELYFDTELTSDATAKTTCGWTYKDGTGMVKKDLDPKEFDYSLNQCYTILLKSIWGDNLPDGWRKGELFPEIIDRVVAKQTHQFNQQLLYILFLSKQGSSFPFLTQISGVFEKLLAGVANNDGTVDAGAITDNDLLPANIEATMYRIYIAQSELLKDIEDSQKVFWTTRTVYEAWRRFLQTKTGLNNTLQTSYITDGIEDIRYQNIPLVNLSFIDRGLAKYELTGSPAAVTDPHRVILTLPSNHKLMIDGAGFEMIDPFYDRKDDLVYSPASAMIDYQYGWGEFNVIAGF